MNVKTLVLPIVAICISILGCTASHYHERQSEEVTFFLQAPGAEKVEFVSSIDDYRPRQAFKQGDARWTVTVAYNSEFSYFYLVDGNVYLPKCELYEKDDFGSRNCVYVP